MTIDWKILKWTALTTALIIALTVAVIVWFILWLAAFDTSKYMWKASAPEKLPANIIASEILSEPGQPLVRGFVIETEDNIFFTHPGSHTARTLRKIARWAVRHDGEDLAFLFVAATIPDDDRYDPEKLELAYNIVTNLPDRDDDGGTSFVLGYSGEDLRRIDLDNIDSSKLHGLGFSSGREVIEEYCNDPIKRLDDANFFCRFVR